MPNKSPINKTVIGGHTGVPWTRQLDNITALIEKHGGVLRDRRHVPQNKGWEGRIYIEFEVALDQGGKPVIVRPETRYSGNKHTTADHAASALMVLVKALFVGIQYGVGLQTIFGSILDPETGYTLTEKALRGELYSMPALEDNRSP